MSSIEKSIDVNAPVVDIQIELKKSGVQKERLMLGLASWPSGCDCCPIKPSELSINKIQNESTSPSLHWGPPKALLPCRCWRQN